MSVHSSTRALLGFCLGLASSGTASPSLSHAADSHWTGSAEIGFDSFSERYAIADDDTLSSIAEFRSRLRCGRAFGAFGHNYTLVELRGMLGESDWEAGGRTALSRYFGPESRHTAHLDAEVARRGFQAGSAYEFPNDYWRGFARAGWRWRASSSLLLRVDDRVEHLDYAQRTEFDYDYTRNAVSTSCDVTRDYTHTFTAGLRVTTMAIPDSAEIEYHALVPFLEYRAWFDTHQRVQISAASERREYDTGAARSSFWALIAGAQAEWDIHPSWSLEVIDDLERYDYDAETEVYAGHVRNDTAVLANFNRQSWQVGAGPAFGWLESESSAQDEYRELGLRVTAEWTGIGGGWVAVGYEPGWRDYASYSSNVTEVSDAIFSDYRYHRLDVFATLRVQESLWINAYADYQPEDHDRAGDDATATVASITLSWTF